MPAPEFLTDDTAPGPEEVLDTGTRRRLGPWILLVACLVVAVTIGAALTAERGRHHPAPAAPSGNPLPVAPGGVLPSGLLAGQFAVDGHLLYFLSSESITRVDISQPGAVLADGVARISGLDLTAPNVGYRLVLDPAANRMWMVTLGVSPAVIIAFDLSSLAQLSRVSWPNALSAAAAFDGQLYLADQNGVLDLHPDLRSVTPIAALRGTYLDVVADPSRSRLLLFGIANGQPRFVAYVPGRPLGIAPAPFGKGWLLAIGGAVWAGGYGEDGAVLVRLDPVTLRPNTIGELAAQVGPGVELVGTGTRALWVRALGSGDELWCVDATNGLVQQAFTFPGPVASIPGHGYRVTALGVTPFRLADCHG